MFLLQLKSMSICISSYIMLSKIENSVIHKTINVLCMLYVAGFDFMDPPPLQTLVGAMESLYTLGALDDEGKYSNTKAAPCSIRTFLIIRFTIYLTSTKKACSPAWEGKWRNSR